MIKTMDEIMSKTAEWMMNVMESVILSDFFTVVMFIVFVFLVLIFSSFSLVCIYCIITYIIKLSKNN